MDCENEILVLIGSGRLFAAGVRPLDPAKIFVSAAVASPAINWVGAGNGAERRVVSHCIEITKRQR
jgi:hypothetical protein